MARYAEVRDALRDWKTFCSSRGAGLTDFAREKPWRPPSIILEADPPLHTRTRSVLARVLARGALERFRDAFEQKADVLVRDLLRRGEIDAVRDLASRSAASSAWHCLVSSVRDTVMAEKPCASKK